MARRSRREGSRRRRAGGRGGFTLLEILMALMIMVISLTSVFALFGAASASHRRALAAQDAAHLAYTILAELEQLPNPGAAPNLEDQTHAAFAGYRYDVTFRQLTPNEIEATVTVKWLRAGRDENEVYRTILLSR